VTAEELRESIDRAIRDAADFVRAAQAKKNKAAEYKSRNILIVLKALSGRG